MSGTADWDADKFEAVGKLGLEVPGIKENGRVGIGDSLVGAGGATSTAEGVSRANVKSFGGSNSGFASDLCTSCPLWSMASSSSKAAENLVLDGRTVGGRSGRFVLLRPTRSVDVSRA